MLTLPIGSTVHVETMLPVPIVSCQLPTAELPDDISALLTTEVPGLALQRLSA